MKTTKILTILLFVCLFKTYSQSPGNVATNLTLWLNAEMGVATSGTNVTSWTDQSSNAYVFNTASGTPQLNTNAINNYSAIEFSGDSYLSRATTNPNIRSFFIVYNHTSSRQWEAPFTNSNGGLFHGHSDATQVYNNTWTSTSSKSGASYVNGLSTDLLTHPRPSSTEIHTRILTANENASLTYYIGQDRTFTGARGITGQIAEIIAYSSVLSDTDRLKVQTYLAIKYGIFQDNTDGGTTGDYIISDGTRVWDASVNSTFHNEIFVLGRDDDNRFDIQSASESLSSSNLTINKGASFTSDLDFMIFGHDGASLEFSSSNVPIGVLNKSQRTWKVETNGSPGLVSVSFTLGGDIPNTGNASDYVILKDNDTNFTDATTHSTGAVIVGNVLTFTNVNFSDGDYFSLGINSILFAPGNVNDGIVSWFKANSGTSTTTDGVAITQWNNTVGATHATQAGTTNFPTYKENIHNFNPAVYFLDGDDGYFDLDLDAINNTDYNIIAIVERDNTETQNYFLGTTQSSSNQGLHFGYRNNNALTLAQYSNDIDVVVNNYDTPAVSKALVRGQLDGSTGKVIQELRDGVFSANSHTNKTELTGNNPGVLGRGFNANGFRGYVSEVILYNKALSNADLAKIYSYLAIKYGMTLDSTDGITNGDYTDSSSNILWDASANATYHNEVIGIGKDEDSALNQQKSIEPRSSTQLIIDKGTSFDNNQDFILIGNNSGTIGLTSTGKSPFYTNRVERIWKAQVTGTPGTIDISFTIGSGITNTTNVDDYALLIDTDTNFSNAVVHTTGATLVGNQLTFTNVSLADGATFTLGVGLTLSGPGGIGAGLNFWLKSDANLTTSGTSITAWGDSENSFDFTTNSGSPQLSSNGLNYNPVVDFDGDDNLKMTGNLDIRSFFIVYNHTSTREWETPFTNNNSDGLFHGHSDGTQVYNATYTAAKAQGGTSYVNGLSTDLLTHARPTTTEIHSRILTTNETANTEYTLGSDRSGGVRSITGQIAEIISYNTALSNTDRIKIQTYLAIKYGITLDASGGGTSGDYVNSVGTTIWDASDNTAYNYGVAAIGLDEESGLFQKQSKSESTNAILTMSIDTSVASSNQLNGGGFDDNMDFLFWSNNSAGTAVTIEDADTPSGTCLRSSKKINRDWKVRNVGSVGAVTLSFDLSNVPDPDNYDLLIDQDGDGNFDTGTVENITTGVVTGSTLTFTGVTLLDGEVFTLQSKTRTGLVIYGNGVWYGGTGTANAISTSDSSKSVQILENVTLAENAVCDCMNIATGSILTVPTASYVKVINSLELDGNLYLEGSAELIQSNASGDVNTGSGSVYKILNEATSSIYRYNYFASPVHTGGVFSIANNLKINEGPTLGDNSNPGFINNDLDGFGTTFSTRWFHTLNNDDYFTEIDQNTSMAPGIGFTMKGTSTANAYNLIGTPNNGDIDVSISAGKFLLTGNPYPSTISANAFNTVNNTVTDGTIYLWDQPVDTGDHFNADTDNSGGYATITNGVTVAAATLEDESTAVSGATTPSLFIKPGQGFIVYSTSGGTVSFSNTMRDGVPYDGSRHFFKTNNTKTLNDIKPLVRLGFEYQTNDNKTYHRQLVTSLEGNTLEKEIGKDAFMFDYYNNDAYWIVENDIDRFIITSVPNVSETLELPIGVVVDSEKEVTFNIDDVENLANDIYLLDKELGNVAKISGNNTYTTTVASGDHQDRFSLVFKEAENLDTEYIDTKSKTVIYIQNKIMNVVLEQGTIQQVELYNLAGQKLIAQTSNLNTSHTTINLENLATHLYVVKLTTNNGSFTQKIALE